MDLFKHTHTQVHTYTYKCLLYRKLPSVWRHNVDSLKQLNSELGAALYSTSVLKGQIAGGEGSELSGEPSGRKYYQGLKFAGFVWEEEMEWDEDCHKQRQKVEMSITGAGHWPV